MKTYTPNFIIDELYTKILLFEKSRGCVAFFNI